MLVKVYLGYLRNSKEDKKDGMKDLLFLSKGSQFGNGDVATANPRARRNLNVDKSSKRAPRRKKKANIEQDSQATGVWIDLKQTANTPKNAGKRRVRTDDQSPGHWTMGDGGTKVYVSTTGKKLTGRLAYMNYKKENGGFKKPAKKRTSKKKF